MRISLVHYLHAKTGTVEDVCPGVDHFAFRRLNRLVEVETISRFLHTFLSVWRGLYLHLNEVSDASVVLCEKRLTPTSL